MSRGVLETRDFIQKYELSGCMQCGSCTGGCPIALKAKLNVRRIIRSVMIFEGIGLPLEEGMLWGCTTCSTCENICPRKIKPDELLVGLRNIFVEEGRVPPTVRDALESIYKHGNPWGRIRDKRSEWAQDLKIKHASEGVDLLYFVCCSACYDTRVQEVAKAISTILNLTGINFGTLGNEESCCGSEVYNLGEAGLFELLVEENVNLFEKYDAKGLITTSPHCFHAFKNRYGSVNFEVLHYTQYITELLDKDKLKLTREIDGSVTYHDPCYLGKRNAIYDEPRKILESIPGLKLVEMDRSRETSLCCEGGGGRMWMDIPGVRLAEIRVKEAVRTGANILATACPFCLLNLEDAVKTTGNEDKLQVLDIAEIVLKVI